MLATIIFCIILAVSLSTIAFIIIRKFPQAARLDVESLPMERESRKKKEILARRVDEEERRLFVRWQVQLQPLIRLWRQFQLKFRIYVGKIERLWHHEQKVRTIQEESDETPQEKESKISILLRQGESSLFEKNYQQAEELYISAIKIDPRSVAGYRGLADTYLAQGAFQEASDTYQFLLRLTPDDDAVMIKLAEIAEEQGETEKAIEYYQQAVVLNDFNSARFYHMAELLLKVKQPHTAKEAIIQAVELEPKNPKYLDLLIETVILCGDKDLAEQAYNELRMVNPENQKLAVWREKINNL